MTDKPSFFTKLMAEKIKLVEVRLKSLEGFVFDTVSNAISSLKLEKGDKGDRGDKGERGTLGVSGKDGSDGKNGLNGSDGKNGGAGVDGLDGRDGTNGIDGRSAFDIWLEDGNEGTEEDFLESLKGGVDDDGNPLGLNVNNYTRQENHNDLFGLQGGSKGQRYHLTAAQHAALDTAGDVVGPASATDNAVARFDNTTGKLIQDSSATLSDAGDLAVNNLTANDTFTLSATLTTSAVLKAQQTGTDAASLVAAANSGNAGLFLLNDTATFNCYIDAADSDKLKFNFDSIDFGVFDRTTDVFTLTDIAAGGVDFDMVVVTDEKTQNTAGGTFTSGAWRTRDLNTIGYEKDTTSWFSLSSNQITLTAGRYLIYASAPAWWVSRHQTRFYNTTDSTVAIVGSSAINVATNSGAISHSFINGEVDISGTKVFELQHRGTATKASDGFGLAGNFGTEVYSTIQIIRLGP